jgi:pSer/pThr/pTyr-binding forkhead associated (FHA) protein
MELEIGIVCGGCDVYSPLGTVRCAACGDDLTLSPRRGGRRSAPSAAAVPVAAKAPEVVEPPVVDRQPVAKRVRTSAGSGVPVAAPAPRALFDEPLRRRVSPAAGIRAHAAPSAGAILLSNAGPSLSSTKLSQEELMDQAKNFVCRSCSTPVPVQHKFCGRCGAAVPPEILNARTQFFGQLQMPGRAKLILIRGEGVEGLSYQLNADEHIVGRNGQLVFPDDPFVSPRHANLFYRNDKLVVRDEGSLNGVFLRVRGTVDLQMGDHFLAGEQLFRLEATPKASDGPAPDGTYFYSSPKHQSPFRITQILHGGAPGMTVCARAGGLQIGREGGDLNFPGDLYMSASHCKIEDAIGKITLTDLSSRNGTYMQVRNDRELAHGDYLFIGRKLLRVEITASA